MAEECPLWEAGVGILTVQHPAHIGAIECSTTTLPIPYVVYRGEHPKANRDEVRGVLVDSDNYDINFNLSFAAAPPVNSSSVKARAGHARPRCQSGIQAITGRVCWHSNRVDFVEPFSGFLGGWVFRYDNVNGAVFENSPLTLSDPEKWPFRLFCYFWGTGKVQPTGTCGPKGLNYMNVTVAIPDAAFLNEVKVMLLNAVDAEEPLGGLSADEPLFGPESRMDLDSLDGLQLSVSIQKQYGIRMADSKDLRRALASLTVLASYIAAHRR
jgi:acyl carrier protein